jgi:hypothetical protein
VATTKRRTTLEDIVGGRKLNELKVPGLPNAGNVTQMLGGFSPFEAPTSPPPGFYDPALDAQGRASDRGLDQLLADLRKQGTRSEDQRTLDRGDIERTAGESLADLLRQSGREGEDYGTATGRLGEDFGRSKSRLGEDHTTNSEAIGRNYQRLGASQSQSAVAAGASGGYFAGAAKARAANQGLDQGAEDRAFGRSSQDLQTGFDRTGADLLRDHMRFGEDASTQTTRIGDAKDRGLGEVDRQYGYGVVDRADAGQRATDENTFFQQDLGGQKLFSAGQQGYTLPTGPKNEFRDAQGNPYQVRIEGKEAVGYNPDGTVKFRRKKA